MDKNEAFTYLYLHAVGLAELGTTRFSDLAAADDAGPESPAAPGGLADPLPPAQAEDRDTDDFDLYLSRLYAGRAQLAGRIGALQARVSQDELEQLAERLPTDLPSLRSPMDGRGLSAWLDHYTQGDENLTDIVQRIRCADI